MNLRNEIVIEIQNAEKFFRAHFPQGASFQECYDFLVQAAQKVVDMSKAQQEANTPEITEGQ